MSVRLNGWSVRMGVMSFLACHLLAFTVLFAEVPRLKSMPNEELITAVLSQFPQFTIVQSSDVSLQECESPKHPPGVVEADFNGDGRTDYAVLLKGQVKQRTPWEEKILELFELKFVVLLQASQGEFHVGLEEGLEDYYPFTIGIGIVEPQTVRETPIAGDKKITLSRPGVIKYHCEKFADVYYWNGKKKKFDSIHVMD